MRRSTRVRRVLRAGVDALDRWVDNRVDRWRGRRLVNALSYGASIAGDHGGAWFVLAVLRARRRGPHRGPAVWSVLFTGAVTPGLNRFLKTSVRRARPAHGGHTGPVRIPRSASFPSGHALAAWCAATLLADGDPLAPVYYALAGAVSYSRVHVRLHHASDVVAGAALGIALGALGRRLNPRRA